MANNLKDMLNVEEVEPDSQLNLDMIDSAEIRGVLACEREGERLTGVRRRQLFVLRVLGDEEDHGGEQVLLSLGLRTLVARVHGKDDDAS